MILISILLNVCYILDIKTRFQCVFFPHHQVVLQFSAMTVCPTILCKFQIPQVKDSDSTSPLSSFSDVSLKSHLFLILLTHWL